MRITNKSVYFKYQTNLENIQTRRARENQRISTGEHNVNISDEPLKVVKSKQLTSLIERSEQYKKNIETALGELRYTNENLDSIADLITKVREISIEGTATGNMNNLYTLGTYLKGLLNDMIKIANSDFGGTYLFSGTKTNSQSLDKSPPATNESPFELVKENPTTNNPSGIKVYFKGNFKERSINKDSNSVEKINMTADQLFGTGGTAVFDKIVELYNMFTYRSDGAVRGRLDNFSFAELERMSQLQNEIMDIYDKINSAAAENGAKINRMEAISGQMTLENTRLHEIRSIDSDTDIASSALKLSREESALQYTLQVGARLLPQSLFDFLG